MSVGHAYASQGTASLLTWLERQLALSLPSSPYGHVQVLDSGSPSSWPQGLVQSAPTGGGTELTPRKAGPQGIHCHTGVPDTCSAVTFVPSIS